MTDVTTPWTDPPAVSRARQWAETLLLTVAAPVAGLWLRPADPFFVEAPFCWAALGPVVAGLRYGWAFSLAGVGALFIAVLASGAALPPALGLGVVVLAMVAGEFGDRSTRAIGRTMRRARQAHERAGAFVRAYHELKASHAALQSRMSAAGPSLRDAIEALRLRAEAGPPSADALLALFAEFGEVRLASFHPVTRTGTLATATAWLGPPDGAVDVDPLLMRALRTRSVAALDDPAAAGPGLVAAVPLVCLDGQVLAVVGVRDVPFLSLRRETLQLWAVLGGRMADVLTAGDAEHSRPSFFEAMTRGIADVRDLGLPAQVLVCRTPARHAGALDTWRLQRRQTDAALLASDSSGDVRLFVLLPLTDVAGAEAFAARAQAIAGDAPVSVVARPLLPDDEPDRVWNELNEVVHAPDALDLRRVGHVR